MITIVEQPSYYFKVQCDHCGCTLLYELKDVNVANHIECPRCGETIRHDKKYNISEKEAKGLLTIAADRRLGK